MENILSNYVMVETIQRMNSSLDTSTASIKNEQIYGGSVGDVVDPETGEVVSFQSYVKKVELPTENIIDASDFGSIFD